LNKKNKPTIAITELTVIILKARFGKNFIMMKRKVAGIKKMAVGRVKYNKVRKSKITIPFFKFNFFLEKRNQVNISEKLKYRDSVKRKVLYKW
jgi:hypothetical protein